MGRYRFAFTPRWIDLLFGVALLLGATVGAGFWQWSRHLDRENTRDLGRERAGGAGERGSVSISSDLGWGARLFGGPNHLSYAGQWARIDSGEQQKMSQVPVHDAPPVVR